MAGDVKVAVVSGALSNADAGTADFTKSGFGTVKACIVISTWDNDDNTTPRTESIASIGFSDLTNNYCLSHQDEDASAKVDCDAIKSNTQCYIHLDQGGTIVAEGTASAITDGVRITNTLGATQAFTTVILLGGADLAVSLQSSGINSSADGTATISHSGFTDGNDKLIFFIGSDLSGEDSTSSGINNSFGVCHATGSDAGGWTFVQRCMGWASDHNVNEGAPSSIISTEHVLDMITEAGTEDWALEVTALEHTTDTWTVTTRDNGAGSGMEVYSLALDLDDRKAKVGSVTTPEDTGTWTPNVNLGFIPQYVGLGLTLLDLENTINSGSFAGGHGISSNTGSGEETCHSWYNEAGALDTNTNNLFRSRAIDFRDDDVTTVTQDHSHLSFNDGNWTYTINTAVEGHRASYWAIEEAAGVGEVLDAVQGAYALAGQVAGTRWDHLLLGGAVQGDYAYTGQPADTSKGFLMVAAQGDYALSGQPALFLRTHVMLGDQGDYALSGQDADTLWGHLIDAVQGAYSLSGQDATGSRAVTIIGVKGDYALTGQPADLLWDHLLTAVQGAYAYTGQAAATRVGSTMVAAQGGYSLAGQVADLLADYLLTAVQGDYTYTGFAASTRKGSTMVPVQGGYALTGQPADLLADYLLGAVQGGYSYTGFDASTRKGSTMIPVQGAYVLSGQPAILLYSRLVDAGQGSYALGGQTADLRWHHLLLTVQGSYAYTGLDATTFVTSAETMLAEQGSYAYTGFAALTVFTGGAAGTLLIPIGRRRRRS